MQGRTKKFLRLPRKVKPSQSQPSTLCEPAQSKCTWACHKSHVMRESTEKMPGPKIKKKSRHRLCASLRSQNSHEHLTRAILCKNLQKWRGLERIPWSNPGLNGTPLLQLHARQWWICCICLVAVQEDYPLGISCWLWWSRHITHLKANRRFPIARWPSTVSPNKPQSTRKIASEGIRMESKMKVRRWCLQRTVWVIQVAVTVEILQRKYNTLWNVYHGCHSFVSFSKDVSLVLCFWHFFMCFIQANQNFLLSLMFSCFSSLRLVFHVSSFLKLFFSPQCVLICFNFGQLLPNQVASPRRTSGCLNFSHQCFLKSNRLLRNIKQRGKEPLNTIIPQNSRPVFSRWISPLFSARWCPGMPSAATSLKWSSL